MIVVCYTQTHTHTHTHTCAQKYQQTNIIIYTTTNKTRLSRQEKIGKQILPKENSTYLTNQDIVFYITTTLCFDNEKRFAKYK